VCLVLLHKENETAARRRVLRSQFFTCTLYKKSAFSHDGITMRTLGVRTRPLGVRRNKWRSFRRNYYIARFDHFSVPVARVDTHLYVLLSKNSALAGTSKLGARLRTILKIIAEDLPSTNNSETRLSTSTPLHTYHELNRPPYHVLYSLETEPSRSL